MSKVQKIEIAKTRIRPVVPFSTTLMAVVGLLSATVMMPTTTFAQDHDQRSRDERRDLDKKRRDEHVMQERLKQDELRRAEAVKRGQEEHRANDRLHADEARHAEAERRGEQERIANERRHEDELRHANAERRGEMERIRNERIHQDEVRRANAERHELSQEIDHRQDTKNNWRNIAIAAAGVTAFGLIEHDPTISFIGAAGALYSLDRYEQDRKSQSADARARASIFSHPYFYRDNVRYERREIEKDHHKYFRFVRS